MSTDDRLVPFGLAGLGLALIAVGMFLPLWDEGSVAALRGISENSLLQSGNGWISLILAGTCVVSLIRVWQRPRRIYWPLISGLLVIGTSIYNGRSEDVMTLCPLGAESVTSACQVAAPGIGVYAVGLGGAALAASGVFFLRLPVIGRSAKETAVTRECPFCKSQIPPDASVCAHCRRESAPWIRKDEYWWRQDENGDWFSRDATMPRAEWERYDPSVDQ
jgi:hypothetical protein